jgi:CRP-like cAMP-binding protein
LAAGARGVPVRESRVAVRHDPSRTQIVVTPAQWRILENFAHGTTVPKVLCGLIEAQCCPPLREYYELILKATRSRLLLAAGQGEPDHVAPAKWPVSLKGKIVRWPAVVLILGAIGAVFWRKLPLPADPLWPVLGWLAFCAAASLGSAFAASVTRGADQQVHRARLKWKTLFPRFEFDTGDAALAGRAAEADVALARAAIPALVFTLVAWKEPRLMAGFSVGLLWQWAPWLKSPLQDLLAAWLRDPQLATRYDLALAKSRLYSLLGAARNQIEDGKYLGACAVATVAWLGAVFLAGCALWQANARNLLDRFNAAGGWHYTALGFLGVIGLAVTGAAGTLLWFGWEHFSVWRRERAERALRPKEALMSDESRAEWLGKTVLFREMAKEDLLALAQEAKPEEFARGSFVVKEGEQGDRLYIIVSGRLEVRRDYAPGRSEPVAEIGEGEVFGEIALLHGGVRTRSIRALQKSILLSLDKAAFDRLVLGRMTRGAVENAVQKVGFLESCGLTKHWSHATRADFGRKSELKEYEKGRVLIQQGEPNHWFFLIYRGEVDVVKNGKEIRRLKQGEGFGEMSLVGDGIATATIVVAGHTASFLVVQGRDFLDFITRDFTVGMAWDETRKLPREKRR